MKTIKTLVAALLLTGLIFTSCSKEEDLPTPEPTTIINNIYTNPVDEPVDSILMSLEFNIEYTYYDVGTDTMWTINEGNCIVNQYYLNNGDTLPNGDYNTFPIFRILQKDNQVFEYGCNSQSMYYNYQIINTGSQFVYLGFTWDIIINDVNTFELYRHVGSSANIYMIFDKI